MKLRRGDHELELTKRPPRSKGRATIDTIIGAAEIIVGAGLAYGLAKNYNELLDAMQYSAPAELGTLTMGIASPLVIAADGMRRIANYDWHYTRHGQTSHYARDAPQSS